MVLEADWRLYQLSIFNVIQNAIKFNQFGGSISIFQSIKILEDNKVTLSTTVTDSGKGISKKKQQLLFQPFADLCSS